MVPDDAESCPSCGQDLSSLRALLKDFYSEEPVPPEDQDIKLREPEVFPAMEEKAPAPLTGEVREEIRIVTGPYPQYDQNAYSQEPPSLEDSGEEEARPSTPEGTRRGGFWLRSMALAMDSVILLLLMAIFIVLGFLILSMGGTGQREIPLLRQVGIVLPTTLPLGFVLALSYFTFFHGTWGQTIGKMIFGLRVVGLSGQPMTFSRALMRSLAYFVSAIPFFFGFLWAGLTSSKRSWHDALAGTIVIRDG
jgi:uncharacterized RDD family membrane protein YckC